MASKYDKHAEEWARLHQEEWWQLKDIAEKYECSGSTVRRVLINAGLHKPRSKDWRIRQNAFESIDSDEAAYWVGFILGDGYLYKEQNLFSIDQNKRDRALLERFLEFMEYEGRLSGIYDVGRNGALRVQLRHEDTFNRLSEIGLDRRKADLIYPKQVPAEFDNALIRGFSDADAYVSDKPRWRLSKASERVLRSVEAKIAANCEVTRREPRQWSQSNCWHLNYEGRFQIRSIREWLYRDAEVWMPRKKEAFDVI